MKKQKRARQKPKPNFLDELNAASGYLEQQGRIKWAVAVAAAAILLRTMDAEAKKRS